MTTQLDHIERFKAAQNALGFTQVEMAAYLGISRSTYTNWIQGIRAPSAPALRLLDVLCTVKAFAPGVHACLMPQKGGK